MRSLYSPFDVLRHLHLWNVATFGGDDDGGGTGNDDGGGSTFSEDVSSGKLTNILPPPPQGKMRPLTRKEKREAAIAKSKYADSTVRAVKSTNPNRKKYAPTPQLTAMAAETGSQDPRIVNSAMDEIINRATPFDNKERRGGRVFDMSVPNPNVDQEFQDRLMRQRIAAAVDPYGQSTERGVNLTSGQPLSYTDGDGNTQTIAGEDRANAQKLLDDAGLKGQDYVDAVLGLGTKLDEPRFGPFSGSPTLQGLDYLLDMNKRRAYEQLTGTYEPSGIASALGIANKATARYVPVMDGGQIVGSLSVDANGKPLTYTGQRTANAKVMDPTIDQDAAKAKIASSQAAPMDFPDDNNNTQGAQAPMGGGVNVGVFDPCPAGYVMDPNTQACVPDPVAPVAPATTPPPPAQFSPASSYTAANPYTLPTLNPGPQTAFNVPRPKTQPITIAQQGLGSLPFRSS